MSDNEQQIGDGHPENRDDPASNVVLQRGCRRVKFSVGTRLDDGPDSRSGAILGEISTRSTTPTPTRRRPRVRTPCPCIARRDFGYLLRSIYEADIGEQGTFFSQNFLYMPTTRSQVWHSNAQRLDLRYLDQDLPHPTDQFLFLSEVRNSLKCVVFDAERLADNLNSLERAEAVSLNSVQECHLLLMPKGPSSGAQGDSAVELSSPATNAQWPMHSLPTMMGNLRRLRLQCNVQVHIIERFRNLQLLAVYGTISQSAITGVFEHCRQLERLFIKAECRGSLDLSGIDKCPLISGISVPVSMFANQRNFLISGRNQQLIELSFCSRNNTLTVSCLATIFALKADSIESIQMSCGWLPDGAQSLTAMGMGLCTRVATLVLGNCDFRDVAIESLDLPKVQHYIALNRCHNVTNDHIQQLVEHCPDIRELYVIEGPLLTAVLLHEVYYQLTEMATGHPLTLVLANCTQIYSTYKDMFSQFWQCRRHILAIEFAESVATPMEDVQVFFRSPSQENTSSEEASPQMPLV